MTHVKTLYIGRGSFTVSLECGHIDHVDGWHSIPRPGSSYDCPDCRAQQAQALTPLFESWALTLSFTPVELGRLRFYRWLTGRVGA